jgi:Family of unknown function (DUF6348)
VPVALDPAQRTQRILTAVADRLDGAGQSWLVDGERAVCDGPIAVLTRPDCDGKVVSPKHVELGVSVTTDDGTETLLWDCAVGMAEDEDDAIDRAVAVWAARTMPVFWELFARDGSYAAHYPIDDPEGIPGYHVIFGGIVGWGLGDTGVLRRWVIDNPLLPKLPAVLDLFDPDGLNGVHLFLGGPPGADTAEVRVNGHLAPEATAELRALNWPRMTDPAFVSAYVLAGRPQKIGLAPLAGGAKHAR